MRTYRLAFITLGATVFLVLMGGLVHSTGSALACPDWPLCYGSAFPTMKGGVFYEHGHRITAGTVALLTLALGAALLARWTGAARKLGGLGLTSLVFQTGFLVWAGIEASNNRSPTLALGLAALITAVAWGSIIAANSLGKDRLPTLGMVLGQIVIFQAALGGLTVLTQLPTMVSTTHLATAMIYASTLVYILLALKPGTKPAKPITPRRGVALAVGAVYFQMLFGAVVRHTGSGLACNVDWILCNGSWLPSDGPGWLVWGHRMFALVVAAIVILGTTQALRAAKAQNHLSGRRLALGGHILVTVQIAWGLLTVSSYISAPLATLHLVTGTLLLLDLVALYFALSRRRGVVNPRSAPATSLVGAEG